MKINSVLYIINFVLIFGHESIAYSPALHSPLTCTLRSPSQVILSKVRRYDLFTSTYNNFDCKKTKSILKCSNEVNEELGQTGKNPKVEKISNNSKILQAAFLIVGTTIGGGFLALPTVTATAGFLPSASALTLVWIYLLNQSFILVECLINARKALKPEMTSSLGISATAYYTFGTIGEQITRFLLIILTEATLVSQISRAGTLLFPNQYITGCIFSSLSVAAVVFGPSKNKGVAFSSKANSVLLLIFLISAGYVGVSGVNNVDALGWKFLFMNGNQNWDAVLRTVPTFLQLLVYGEIIPIVCDILNYHEKSIKKSIFIGSFLTLLVLLGWSALGMALVPNLLEGMVDPVDILLQTGGAIQKPLFCLAVTAILTTIMGSYLALLSTAIDLSFTDTKQNKNDTKKVNAKTQYFSGRMRLAIASIITIPATSIASVSPDLFLKAIDFAGNYPVLLLWGVIPSAIALVQRWKHKSNETVTKGDISNRFIGGSTVRVLLLLVLTIVMVGWSAWKDFFWFISLSTRLFQ